MERRRASWGLAVAVACAIAAALWSAQQRSRVRELLMSDPDTLPARGALYASARAAGARAFAQHCAVCHGAQGQGDPHRGAPSLADRDWLYGNGSISALEWTITHGIRAPDPRSWNLAIMPAYATPTPGTLAGITPLDPPQIRDLVEYLLALEQRAHDAAAAARGDALFHGAGACFDCHGTDARGDTAIGAPNLTDAIWLAGDGSRAALFATIARGQRGVCPAWGQQLEPATIRALAVYVHALAAAGPHR